LRGRTPPKWSILKCHFFESLSLRLQAKIRLGKRKKYFSNTLAFCQGMNEGERVCNRCEKTALKTNEAEYFFQKLSPLMKIKKVFFVVKNWRFL